MNKRMWKLEVWKVDKFIFVDKLKNEWKAIFGIYTITNECANKWKNRCANKWKMDVVINENW